MKRELLFLRHGKSDWSVDGQDIDRPLANRGVRNTCRMGNWLVQHAVTPDLIISSPALRARSTAKLICHVMELSTDKIQYDKRIYNARVEDLIKVLQSCPSTAHRVLLIGHNPGQENFLLLVNSKQALPTDKTKVFPTSALATLEFDGNWNRFRLKQTQLISITYPDSVSDTFPYPSASSESLRKKPAYFYHQSAAIPFRINKEKLEIMIVSSHSGKRWVIPKGTIEPDLTAWDSAAKEALEEAGVVGKIDASCLGTYHYKKWGADCEVQVFPLRVTKILSRDNWQENYRRRRWVKPEKAIKLLNHTALESIIRLFEQQIWSR